LYTGKKCVPVISEGLECFGGQGYIEDTGIPTLLRDAQVTPIWEGTTNVLSLDVINLLTRKAEMIYHFKEYIGGILDSVDTGGSIELDDCKRTVISAVKVLFHSLTLLQRTTKQNLMDPQRAAREIANLIARCTSGAHLTSFAASRYATSSDLTVAYRFCVEEKLSHVTPSEFMNNRTPIDKSIVFQQYENHPEM
ncbi:hypothetical protein AB6A40_006357, partial [Gnathostoma spinigerum]